MEQERRLDKYMENTQSRTSEIVTNIKTVKAFATEAQEMKRQRQRLDREFKVVIYRIHLGYIKLSTWQRTIIQFCVFAMLGMVLVATVKGEISLGHFVTTLTVSSMAYAELEPINNLAEIFARRYASMLRYHEFMQQPTGVDAASLVEPELNHSPYSFTGKVELSNLSFSYDPSRPVLQDINLLIEPYQTVALVGRSGSGKSTLVKLLFRYFEPDTGRILIDGQDIRQLDVAGYRRQLAIVHQEVDVFNGTLLDNLTYGNPKASFEQVQSACKIARVDEVIEQLPEGYYTVVGERGVRLSGGQRQRLAIARAILKDPPILILDEATSALDSETEQQVLQNIQSISQNRTVFLIAHRFAPLKRADLVLVLEKGVLAERGTHLDLLRQKGLYWSLYQRQQANI